MKTIKALFGILTITLLLSAQVQAQFAYTNNGDGTCTITGYTGAGGAVAIPTNISGLTVTSIGSGDVGVPVFSASLTSVTIPGSVTSIGDYAFYGCASLTSVTIPSSITSIGDFAFANDISLTNATIPNGVTNIGEFEFEGDSSLTSVTIPNGVTNIGYEAFYFCSRLTNVTIPGSVISIEEYAFDACSSLTNITIPNSVTSIGSAAFANDKSLTNATIGNGVTNIGQGAFSACTNLTSIYFSDEAPTADGTTFQSDSNATGYYLAGITGWNNFSATTGLPVVMLNSSIQTGSLQVTIAPAAAITSGAQWQVNGGALQGSGATVSGLSVGNHTVSFSTISGWMTPTNQSVSVSTNSTATATGTYVALLQIASLRATTALNIALTATYQLPDKMSGAGGNITTGNTKAVSVTSKSILKLIATSLNTNFPTGTYLAEDNGIVEAVTQQGQTTNLSFYITINNASSGTVVSGTVNSVTHQQNGSSLVYTIITFNDGHGNAFTVDGLIKETINLTAQNANDAQTETASFSGNVAGYGTLVDSQGNKDKVVFSGTISGSGKITALGGALRTAGS
jgi:hypothetical protein